MIEREEILIKQILMLLAILTFQITTVLAEFQPWTQKLLEMTYRMDEENITQEMIQKITEEEMAFYDHLLYDILLKKTDYLEETQSFENEIFHLERMVRINRRNHNQYAVLRDEVLIKSYKLLRIQNNMVRKIFQALDYYSIDDFEVKMNDLFAQSQIEIHDLGEIDYKKYLDIEENNKILLEAQKNIKDLYALVAINSNILKYLSISDKKIYRLNKYAQYNVLSSILYIDRQPLVKMINPWLNKVGLDVIKVLLILVVSIIIYFIRNVLYRMIERMFLQTAYFKKYAVEILDDVRIPITSLLIIINLEIAIYIYYDFSTFELMSKIFNIIYAIFFTLIFYQIVNSVARVRIEDIDKKDKKIKDEMVNVSIKVFNFIVIIFGILLVLYLAGVNLTAVLSGLGIGGFAIALAARESLANFFGTISILMSDIFSQGDWIVVDGKEGTVVEIGLRVTTIRTFDNALISIPNGTIANADVQNWSKRVVGRRIKMYLRLKYGSKKEDISSAVEAIRQMLRSHDGIATEKTSFNAQLTKNAKLVSKEDALGVKRTLLVYLDEFSDSSINILVNCFTKTTNWDEWLRVKEDIMYQMIEILEANDLEFALPSLSLYQEDGVK
jgi:MscS family membrane protein